MQQDRFPSFIKLFWPAIVTLSVLIVLLWVFSKVGFVHIELSGTAGNTEVTYTNQATNKSETMQSAPLSFSKRLLPSNYEVLARQRDTSYFELTKTKGFFQSTQVAGKLTPEKSREFVGNNPRTCSYLVNKVLYSYYCSDAFSNVLQHVPAKQSQPTYTAKNTSPSVGGAVEGSAQHGGQTYILIRTPQTENSSRPTHTAYLASSNFSLSSPVALKDLDNNRTYELSEFQNGFLVFNGRDSDYWYYGPGFTNPKRIGVPKVNNETMDRKLVGYNNDTLVIARSDKADFENHDNPNLKIGKVKTQVDIFKNGSFKTVLFDQKLDNFFTGLQPCGSENICFISNKTLYVYELLDATLHLKYTLRDVSYIYSLGNQTLLVRNDGILNFNVDSTSGFLEYSFGDFQYCGFQPVSESSFIVCVSNESGVPFALLIDDSKDNTDSIDKKVAQLEKDPLVKAVSAYGNAIYISPDQGNFVYIPSLGEYGPDPAARTKAIKDINAVIQKIGIDTSKYKIVY